MTKRYIKREQEKRNDEQGVNTREKSHHMLNLVCTFICVFFFSIILLFVFLILIIRFFSLIFYVSFSISSFSLSICIRIYFHFLFYLLLLSFIFQELLLRFYHSLKITSVSLQSCCVLTKVVWIKDGYEKINVHKISTKCKTKINES